MIMSIYSFIDDSGAEIIPETSMVLRDGRLAWWHKGKNGIAVKWRHTEAGETLVKNLCTQVVKGYQREETQGLIPHESFQ